MNKELLEEINKGNISRVALFTQDESPILYTEKYVKEKDKEIEKLKLHIIKIKEAISTWNIENDEGHNDFKIPNKIIDIVWSDD